MRTKEQTKRDKLLQNFKLYKTQLINSQKFISQITAKAFFRSSRPDVAAPATLLKKSLWHRCFPVNLRNF